MLKRRNLYSAAKVLISQQRKGVLSGGLVLRRYVNRSGWSCKGFCFLGKTRRDCRLKNCYLESIKYTFFGPATEQGSVVAFSYQSF